MTLRPQTSARSTAPAATPSPVLVETEVAFLLRSELGPHYAWLDFLRDGRRGKYEHSLHPDCCAGRRWYYATDDIMEFITEFKSRNPDARPGVPLQIISGPMAAKTKVWNETLGIPLKVRRHAVH